MGPLKRAAVLTAVAVVAIGGGAAAQEPTPEGASDLGAVRRELGIGLLGAVPVGELAQYVGGGTGFRIFGVLYLGDGGAFALRLDGTLISYGKTSDSYDLSLTGTTLAVDVTTENTIASFAVGPHVVFGRGMVRPYVGAAVGSAQFATSTAVWSGGRAVPVASSELMERHTWVVQVGGGARLALGEGRRRPLSLEVDGRYQRHGRTEYLREGGVRELPDGSIELEPISSEANLWTVHVGVVIGFR